MPLRLADVQAADIPRLVDVYFAAFHDPLRLAAFPDTPSTRAWWRDNLAGDLRDGGVRFVKCVDAPGAGGSGAVDGGGAQGLEAGVDEAIVAFAQWRVPVDGAGEGGSTGGDGAVVWPVDGEGGVADAFFGRAKEMHRQVMGDEGHWYLELICTAPEHQRKGAASTLIRSLFEEADRAGQTVYLESSPSGVSTYKRLGFVEKASFGVVIKGEEYRNLCMVREPGTSSQ